MPAPMPSVPTPQRIAPRAETVTAGMVDDNADFGEYLAYRQRSAGLPVRDRDISERYLLEVPHNTSVRRPSHWPGRAQKWKSVRHRRDRHPAKKWRRLTLREGHKGPIEVRAFCTRVETRREKAPARLETLLVMQALRGSQTWYFLAPADAPLDLVELVRAAADIRAATGDIQAPGHLNHGPAKHRGAHIPGRQLRRLENHR